MLQQKHLSENFMHLDCHYESNILCWMWQSVNVEYKLVKDYHVVKNTPRNDKFKNKFVLVHVK